MRKESLSGGSHYRAEGEGKWRLGALRCHLTHSFSLNPQCVCVFFPFFFLNRLSQTTMVSLEGLTKVVDPSQLTADFDGSLDYNHEEWIEVRRHRERSDSRLF